MADLLTYAFWLVIRDLLIIVNYLEGCATSRQFFREFADAG